MDSLIGFLFLVGFIWIAFKFLSKALGSTSQSYSPSASEPKPAVTIRLEGPSLSRVEQPDTGGLEAAEGGGWTLNPKASFRLTLHNIDKPTAIEIKSVLDNYDPNRRLEELALTSGLGCKEVDEYVAKFRPLYLRRIEELKSASQEWSHAALPDREDLLHEFRQEAIESLDVQPECDLVSLFSDDKCAEAIQSLARRYGAENLRLYVRNVGNQGKVRRVQADHHERQIYEELADIGLARRGGHIEIGELLSSLTLKELNTITTSLGAKHFTRKAPCVEYLSSSPRILEAVEGHVALRELFQLIPPAGDLAQIDLDEANAYLDRTRQTVHLIRRTYYSARSALWEKADEFTKGWEINAASDCCPICQRIASKKYAKNRRPRVPIHIGCRCSLQTSVE